MAVKLKYFLFRFTLGHFFGACLDVQGVRLGLRKLATEDWVIFFHLSTLT